MATKIELPHALCVEDSNDCYRNMMLQLFSSTNGTYGMMNEKCLSTNDGLTFPLGPCVAYEDQQSVLYTFSARHPSSSLGYYFSTLG